MTQDTREDVIEKVRKILAKADPSRNDCEAEAANALRIAKRLMAEHGLDTADIEVSGEDAEDGNFNFVNCQNETEYKGFYVNHIINAVATITSTRAFRTAHHQADGRHIKYRVTFCGTETDAAVASAMFTMLLGMTKARARSFASQTAAEKQAEQTTDDNGVGFTGIDAEILSSFAKQYEARGWLTPKQMALLRKKMRKYWRQVLTACDLIKLDSLIAGTTFTRAAA